MSEPNKPTPIRLSPNVRLRLTLQYEMDLDREGKVFTDALRAKYVDMHEEAIKRQNALIRWISIYDSILILFLVNGPARVEGDLGNIGGVAVDTLFGLPVVSEALAVLSSITFLFAALAFFNSQSYAALVQGYAVRSANLNNIDPDFISSGDIFTEWYTKLFAPEMNNYGIDFYKAGAGYKRFYGLLTVLIIASVLLLVFVHFAAVGFAVANSQLEGLFWWITAALVVLLNTTAVILFFNPSFQFHVTESKVKTED